MPRTTIRYYQTLSFFSWLGQAQLARRLETLSAQVIGRVDLQLANDRLFPLEQFAVGGRYSVRGYRENQARSRQRVPFLN